MNWDYDIQPTCPGYYPVLICYDGTEGILPDAAYWDGIKWSRTHIIGHGIMCETEQLAFDLAYENGIEK